MQYNFGGKANHAPGYYHPDWHDFAPRLSIAYNPSFTDGFLGHVMGDRKTVIELARKWLTPFQPLPQKKE